MPQRDYRGYTCSLGRSLKQYSECKSWLALLKSYSPVSDAAYQPSHSQSLPGQHVYSVRLYPQIRQLHCTTETYNYNIRSSTAMWQTKLRGVVEFLRKESHH